VLWRVAARRNILLFARFEVATNCYKWPAAETSR
jgi:hypothetical protein